MGEKNYRDQTALEAACTAPPPSTVCCSILIVEVFSSYFDYTHPQKWTLAHMHTYLHIGSCPMEARLASVVQRAAPRAVADMGLVRPCHIMDLPL